MSWRRTLRVIHRDTGYIVAALTIIYALSGIAVNHINDWNPNYVIEKDTIVILPIIDSILTKEQAEEYVISKLSINDSIKSSFRKSPVMIDLFFKNKTVSANLKNGIIEIEEIEDRLIFKESNFLHLNTPKKMWTWIADIFALGLILLAISGLIMNKGKHGFRGRGKWFFLLGVLIPTLILFLYY